MNLSPRTLFSAPSMRDPSTPASPRVDPPMDSLQLPLPPTTLTFSFPSKPQRPQAFRYNRAGTRFDAQKAVIGKGGFGTVYRFERDDSFTPPSSFETQLPSKSRDNVSTEDVMSFPQTPPRSPRQLSPRNGLAPLPPVTLGNPRSAGRASEKSHHAPAVIIVKVCRTPSSGSFDEMPKTGLGRTVAKAADAALSKGDASGFHTRIVRGEARLLRFLQMMARRDGRGEGATSVVRLLADLPVRIGADGATVVDERELPPEEQSGPVPRLLIFERMVDLDAVMTPDGWSKKNRVWTHAEVEEVARDIAAGLSFLHSNHIVHGDLKPSNVMRDSKTGAAKLIDLGASRRFVCVPNQYKESTTAVEELDQFIEDGTVPPQTAQMIHSEGLGSLTGSPYFMAPEVLLQAGRYLDRQGLSRSILHDYVNCQALLPATVDRGLFALAFDDFKRGWGIKADIWSWACSVLALLLKTLEPEKKKSSSTICPFSFSFDVVDQGDLLEPRHRLHRSERKLPRFHEWARLYPITIVKTVTQGVPLPPEASALSSPALGMLAMSFQHMDQRPSASVIYKALHSVARDPFMPPKNWGKHVDRRRSLTPSIQSENESLLSHVGSAHNVDIRPSDGPGASYASGLQRASYSECSALQPFPRIGSQAQAMSSTSTLSIAPDSMTSSPNIGTSPLPEFSTLPNQEPIAAEEEANEDSEMQDVMSAPIAVAPVDASQPMELDDVSGASGSAADQNGGDEPGGSRFLDRTRSRIKSFLPRRNTVTNRNEGRARGQTITARNYQQSEEGATASPAPGAPTATEGQGENQAPPSHPASAPLVHTEAPAAAAAEAPSGASKRRRSILVLHSLSKRVSQTFNTQHGSTGSGSIRNSPILNTGGEGFAADSPSASLKSPTRAHPVPPIGEEPSIPQTSVGENMKRKSLGRLRGSGFRPKE